MVEITMTPLLKWQYEQLVKELLLLQDHLTDPDSPCETESEMCIRKHLLIIEAYAQETVAMEQSREYRENLEKLVIEAREKRRAQERELLGEGNGLSKDHKEWVRGWRKYFEPRSLGATGQQEFESEGTCTLPELEDDA